MGTELESLERVDVLCGCGWARLGMDPEGLEDLEDEGCPYCGRAFDVEGGWSQ